MAQSPNGGSSGKDPAAANVYVRPAPDTATRQGERWLRQHPVPRDLPDLDKTANVYVPPAQGLASALDFAGADADHRPPCDSPADDGASPWAVLGLTLACAALLCGAALALAHRRRARRSVA